MALRTLTFLRARRFNAGRRRGRRSQENRLRATRLPSARRCSCRLVISRSARTRPVLRAPVARSNAAPCRTRRALDSRRSRTPSCFPSDVSSWWLVVYRHSAAVVRSAVTCARTSRSRRCRRRCLYPSATSVRAIRAIRSIRARYRAALYLTRSRLHARSRVLFFTLA